MSGGVEKPMICFNCGMRIRATIARAKACGWRLWVGGAHCKVCSEAIDLGESGGTRTTEGTKP